MNNWPPKVELTPEGAAAIIVGMAEKGHNREAIAECVSVINEAYVKGINVGVDKAASIAFNCDKSTHPTDVGEKILGLKI